MGTGTGTGNLLFFLVVSEPVSEKFGTEKSPGTGLEKKLVPKKVSEPVLEKFGTGTNFCCQNLEILKIYNGYSYRYREFVIFSGGIGTNIGKNWYQKKVSEPVSEKFGTRKNIGTGIENI